MNVTSQESDVSVDDIVEILVGSADGSTLHGDLRAQIAHAARLEEREARQYAGSLVESLCENSSHPLRLEALLILGLSRPRLLAEHRVDLVQEGKRFAMLLERRGEVDRARGVLEVLGEKHPDDRSIDRELANVMRRHGGIDELVDRYLTTATEHATKGRSEEAIRCLQEALLLDRSRRDIARMIRDMRYSAKANKQRARGRNRLALVLLLLSAVVVGVGIREREIGVSYRALPAGEDLTTMRTRLEGIDGLLDEHRFWLGMFRPLTERERLRERIATTEERRARETQDARQVEHQRDVLADAARERGVLLARQGEYGAALIDLQHALELSSDGWPHRERVLADVAAIERFQQDGRSAGDER